MKSDAGSQEQGAAFTSLNEVLRRRAADQPHDRAFIFLSDRGAEAATLTFDELARRATDLAARISRLGAPGDRALLVFPPGVDFIVGFFGCLLAGIIAVPMMPPRRVGARDASGAISGDCEPRFALTNAALFAARPDVVERYRALGIACHAIDAAPEADEGPVLQVGSRGEDDLAFLQYTSGSTSVPKGVMVTHRNLVANLEMMRLTLGNTRQSTCVSWVPLYHDMGLILGALLPLYLGATCVLMAPATFTQRPMLWLQAIARYRAAMTCAPNFAYDWCVDRLRPEAVAGLDLSSWQVALNGAEPVRAATLDRFAAAFSRYGFRPQAMYPAYGMAEATLLISGGERGSGPRCIGISRTALQKGVAGEPAGRDDEQVLVACGRSVPGGRVAIVDTVTRRRLATRHIGEIWVSGPHVAAGYWRNPQATAATFEARLAEEASGPWLRTGDLGFQDEAGALYITGRSKDLLIIRGMNHYPQDIEDTVQSAHKALRRNGGAAFTVANERGEEELVIVQEVERTHLDPSAREDLEGCIREALVSSHDLSARAIVLIRPGTAPKTTSGKIQRSRARQLWLEHALDLAR